MDIQTLTIGVNAPSNGDRIAVSQLPSGKFRFDGVVWRGGVPSYFGSSRACETLEEARDAGIAWADERGVSKLYVERFDA